LRKKKTHGLIGSSPISRNREDDPETPALVEEREQKVTPQKAFNFFGEEGIIPTTGRAKKKPATHECNIFLRD